VWVLGDNPEESLDSRQIGPIPIDRIAPFKLIEIKPISKQRPNQSSSEISNYSNVSLEQFIQSRHNLIIRKRPSKPSRRR